ncbi:MAG: AAA family ATPase [Acidobacteriota bacterium]
MRRILIFGNSGSGKSTLARKLQREEGIPHLDLDTLAWRPDAPTTRAPLEVSERAIREFQAHSRGWVIEGCYADLLERAAPDATEMIFLDLPAEACIENARRRPWEPHKYESPEAQNANLEMLVEWIAGYDSREDALSRKAHEALFSSFAGTRVRLNRTG